MLAHRNVLASLVSLAVAGGAASLAQEQPPKAVLSETEIDFGIMAHGDTAKRTVTLENRGEGPLFIRSIRVNCACAEIENPGLVEPNGKAELHLDFDTETLVGPSQAIVNIFTNDPANPRLDLFLKVESRPYVWAEPGHFRYILYQHFAGDPMVSQVVMATAPGEFEIERVEAPPYMKVEYRPASREERNDDVPGDQWIVEGHVKPDVPVGPLDDWVRIYTNHPKQKKLSLAVSGFVRPLLHATPPHKELGEIEIGDGLSWSHLIRNFGEPIITIERVESDVAWLHTKLTNGKNDHEFVVSLEIGDDAPRGPFAARVTIYTSSPEVPRIVVPVSGDLK